MPGIAMRDKIPAMFVGNGHIFRHAKANQVAFFVAYHQIDDGLAFVGRDFVGINSQQCAAALGAVVNHREQGAHFFGGGLHGAVGPGGQVGDGSWPG